MMRDSPFTVAGMSSTTNTHNPNVNNWGGSSTNGPLAGSFGDSLSQSRSHYQSGQSNNVPQNNQRPDEVPIVPTKAKMNQMLSRGAQSDFGMESMFKSSRQPQRQALTDEDAPPTYSVLDIPNEIISDSPSTPFQPKKSTFDSPHFSTSQPPRRHLQSPPVAQNSQPVYIIVFGYPPDKYSVTAEYFKSLGECTEPDPNLEITNCFRIGYRDPGDAMRAVRKNGEVFNQSWMIGVKWSDPSQAEAYGNQPLTRSTFAAPPMEASTSIGGGNDMAVDPPYHGGPSTPTVGTPVRLAPSTSAFKKGHVVPPIKAATPQAPKAWASSIVPASASAPAMATSAQPAQPSPNKGVFGQVSDLIFGW